MAQFGELLAELRQDRGMTQKDLAQILFVSVGTISNYEKGKHLPDVEKLVALAEFFNVTTDYLLGRCSSNLSPDVFEEVLPSGISVGCFIQDVKNITPERQQSLAVIMNDMKLGMMIDKFSHKEKS